MKPSTRVLLAFLALPVYAVFLDKNIDTLQSPIQETFTYGTYTVPSRSQDNGMLRLRLTKDPPCTDCLITSMSANIQYANGTTADAATGLWMHHITFANKARLDSICGDKKPGQLFFGAGNDRSPLDLTVGGTQKVGYPLGLHDEFFVSVELMNMGLNPENVTLTTTWAYVPSSAPYQPASPYWLSVSGCSAADMPAIADSKFTYSSPPFHLNPSAENVASRQIVWLGHHVHDGAVYQTVLRNGLAICNSTTEYGMEDGIDGIVHFDHVPFCKDLGPVQARDEFVVVVGYDTERWRPMVNADGSLEGVMGIALLWVVDSGETVHRRTRSFGLAIGVTILLTIGLLIGWFKMFYSEKSNRNGWPKWLAREKKYMIIS